MTRLRIASVADEEFANALRWYAERHPAVAERFRDDFFSTVEGICAHPKAWTQVANDYRAALLRHFPYRVIYLLHEEEITVVAVHHTARDEARWRNRVEEEAMTYGSHPDAPELAAALRKVAAALPTTAPEPVRERLLELASTT